MNDELKYDGNKMEYYITPEAILNNRVVSDKELRDSLKDPDKALKDFSHQVYRYIYRYYKGEDKGKHQEEIRYLLDTYPDKRKALKEAMIEYTMGALISELDLNRYLAEQGASMPTTVHEELSIASLLRRRTRHGDDPLNA